MVRLIRILKSSRTWWRYRKKHRYVVRIGEVEVRFSIDDWHSRSCFLPRYDNGRIHEPVVTALVAVLLRRARAFVDVGAHIGYYSCIASKLLGDAGCVFAFELDSRSFALARRNLDINECSNTQLFHNAVTDGAGTVTYFRPKWWSGPGLSLASTQGGERASVESLALDEHFGREFPRPAVFKIDVEGTEAKVLKGMSAILALPDVDILLEVHGSILRQLGSSESEVIDGLRHAGYKVFWLSEFRLGELRRWRALGPGDALPPNTFVYATRGEPPSLDEVASRRCSSGLE